MLQSLSRVAAKDLTPNIFFKDFLGNKPLVITGLAEHWPAITKWTLTFFKENYGDLIVPVRQYNTSGYKRVYLTLGEYLEYWNALDCKNKNRWYLADWEISNHDIPLLEDFVTPIYFQEDWFDRLPNDLKFARTWIFIGHPYVSTPLHQDTLASSAWLTMIKGSKKIRLVPPVYDMFFAGIYNVSPV